MIITSIRMIVPQDKRQELLQTINTLAGSMRKERGCRSCDFYVDIEHTDTFLLIEEWEDEDDFDRHIRSTAFSALLGALTLLKEGPDVRINAVSETVGMEKIKSVRAA